MGRIKKAIQDYWNRTDKNKGCFYVKDFIELMEMSHDKYELMCNSLNAGYVIGYRSALRDAKKKKER